MKNRILAVILATAAILCLCACKGPTDTEIPGGGSNMTTESTEIITTEAADGFTHLGAFAYLASGYKEYDETKDMFSFRSGFSAEIKYHAAFNRYSITYDSLSPLKVTLTYETADGEATDTVYLEAGTEKTFSAIIAECAAGKTAQSVSRIDIDTADKNNTRFVLRGFATEVIDFPAESTYYVENNRYRVGVLLSWGGGISYIEDKEDNDPSITNLINHCDTGRLVQQSYYGVGNGPYYTSATYNGTPWSYNPVQGGDQYGNAARIIDFCVGEDKQSVYIKAQPMDWAQNNQPCPAYMENTYTLMEDGIRVENRFVDFMGAPHPASHQELPAFYVISHLGVFHYYGGTKPWTGDTYTTLPEEPFWAGQPSCYHNISSANTETWAAWTNTDGYGIGLFVPGTEIMLAGRFSYNGSKSAANGATNYVAPLRTMKITSFKPFSYSYVIATGTVEQMRATFEKYK